MAAVFAIVAAACSSNDNGTSNNNNGEGQGNKADCSEQFGCVTYKKGEPIKIGTLLAISGDTASLGLDSQHGAALAIDHLDGSFDGTDGQLLGHAVQLVNEDDGCSADGGQAGATKLAADPTILSVIGTSCSSSALGVADKIFSDKGILLISPSNTNPNLTAEGTHQPFYLRTAHNDTIQGAIVADYAAQKVGAKTAATIHDESPYADALAAVFRQVFELNGGKIVGDEAIQSTDTDFKPLLTTIGQNKPDFLYYPDFNPACGLIAKQAVGVAGLENTQLGGSDGCGAPDYSEIGGPGADGTFISGPDLSAFTQGDFYQNEFLPAYQDQFGTKPTASFHAHAYDAMNILFDAIKAVAVENDDGSITIPRDKLREAIFSTNGYDGVTGTITCTPLGDCATDVTIGVYIVPNDPFTGSSQNAKPVFSETKVLADVQAQLSGG
ncbi:MAG: branched-chain amino acid ABC transporter substrate-binding protein [Actinomycetota bacterium]